jgi:Holliday junction resolvase-like predicted endonuclease
VFEVVSLDGGEGSREVSYYDRTHTTNEQGQVGFASPADREAEDRAALILEATWNCKLHRYQPFDEIDWYASRGGRTVAFVELKTRNHESTRHGTVFLNYRKHLTLTQAWRHTGKRCLFVVQFTDGIWAINVLSIDASDLPLRGCKRIVKSPLDIEPVIEVPVSSMTEVKT